MSTDWSVVCDSCKVFQHLGQRFTSGPTLGYGTGDVDGQAFVASFINNHLGHVDSGLRIVTTDEIPDEYVDADPDSSGRTTQRQYPLVKQAQGGK